MDYLIHGANVLYLVSYAVRDILWLRILTVVAALTLIVYFLTRSDPLYVAVYWNLLFTAINIFWVIKLIVERRPVRLTGNDLRLYQLVFRCLTPREMRKLLNLGTWRRAEPGECFIHEGETLDHLMVICAGKVEITRANGASELLGAGQFVGGSSFISARQASADASALETTWYMSWPKDSLNTFLKNAPELNAALTTTIGFDIVNRLDALHGRATG